MVSFRAVVAGLGLAALAQPPSCLAYPTANASLGHDLYYDDELIKRDEGGDKSFWLRVMPLGASITAGTNGPPGNDKNGYRKFLRDELVSQGWKVNMVGTFISGTMNDNDHEGVAGDTVSMVAARTQNACHVWRPNVVLINAGTNDATGKQELVSSTGVRMEHLINSVFSQVPDAVVVLSTLLPNTDGHQNTGPKQPNVDDINAQYRALVRQYVPNPDAKDPTFKVILADMVAGDFINNGHIHDNVHPTTEGNKRMAAVWSHAIKKAYELDWISPPSGSGQFDDNDTKAPTCRKKYGSGNDDPRAGRWVLGAADSRITNDGQYKHGGTLGSPKGTFEGTDEARIWMAQLFNHGLPKLQAVEEVVFVSGDNSARKIMWQKNNGGGNLEEAREITTIKDGCKTRGIHWGDVDGDGLDDFICIAKDGEMFVWINDASNGEDPTFSELGSYKKPEMDLGQEHVRLGDIDGDGRLDYCVIKSDGNIHCWRNGGTGQRAEYWQDMGVGKPIFTPKGMGDIRGVRFADINADGRDDWVWVSKKGEVTTWINQRGNSKSMIPYWQVAEWNPTHAGVDEDVGDDRERIQFGRFFGSGKSDYLHYKSTSELGGGRKLTWRIWENTGKGGGKYQKGDGAYWGDMTNNGVDDYIWISPEGLVTIFRNKNSQNSNDGYATGPWRPGLFGIDAKKDLGNVGVDDDIRRGMHIGDWDGDGFEDIIYADRKTGALTVWINQWDEKESVFNFKMTKVPNSDKCNLGWGLLYRDHAAHFADISGSGRVDYLCMRPDGYTYAWIRDNTTGVDSVGKDVGQVKFGEGWDRANLQFADVDGDKRADLIWTDKFTGDGWVWYNKGPGTTETDNSAYRWESREKVYQGSSRGPNMHFPNLGGQGRADMVGINPTTGKGQAWFNSCPRGGDDPDTPDHPGLPVYDEEPIDPPVEDGDHWFCDVKNSGWDAELWNEHGMGDWVSDRIALYTSLDADWPRPNDGTADKDDVGIPRIIAAYDALDRDGLFEWHATCRSIKEQCSLTGATVKIDECKQHPKRAFTLWAASNLARFLQTWHDEIDSAATSSSLWTADISKKFLYYPESSDFSNPGAWLTVTAGIFASFGTLLPPVGSLVSNGLAGISTIASGAAGFLPSAPPQDARFDTYADLSVGLGKFILEVGTAMTEYFNMLLRDTPPSGADPKDAQTLADLLNDGFWASMDADNVTPSPDLQRNLVTQIRASMIAEAWNSVSVGIIKWSEDSEFSNVLGFNPCFGDKNMRGMDHAISCLNGVNYAITPMYFEDWNFNDREKIEEWVNVGQDNDTLAGYNLSTEKIIQAAERTQRILNGYRVRDEDTLSKFITDAINNWDGSLDGEILTDRLRIFNVPVCELDYATTIPRPAACNNMEDWGNIQWKKCAISMMSTGCSKLVLNEVPWPYEEGPASIV